jgi:hypothetical protein
MKLCPAPVTKCTGVFRKSIGNDPLFEQYPNEKQRYIFTEITYRK